MAAVSVKDMLVRPAREVWGDADLKAHEYSSGNPEIDAKGNSLLIEIREESSQVG
jgi:hypothetical protein